MSAQRFQRCHFGKTDVYGASAWSGFTRASERDRIEAFNRRCKRSELCFVNIKTFAEICDTSDNRLFNNITRNPHPILHQLLPSVSAAAENYNLRPRKHNRLLSQRTTRLFDANFIYRALYSIHTYIHTYIKSLI